MNESRLKSTEICVHQESKLILIQVQVKGFATPFIALVDTGASNNFVRAEVVMKESPSIVEQHANRLVVRLADGSKVVIPKRTAKLTISFDDFQEEDHFVLLDMDEKFDIILGMPWLLRHQPRFQWEASSIEVIPDITRTLATASLEQDDTPCIYASVEVEDSITLVACDGPTMELSNNIRKSVSFADEVIDIGASISTVNRYTVLSEDEDVVDNEVHQGEVKRRKRRKRSSLIKRQRRKAKAVVERIKFQGSSKKKRVGRSSTKTNKFKQQDEDFDAVLREFVHLTQIVPSSGANPVERTPEQGARPPVCPNVEDGTLDQGSICDTTQYETIQALVYDETGDVRGRRLLKVENPPSTARDMLKLPRMSMKALLRDIKVGRIEQVCQVIEASAPEFLNTSSNMDPEVLEEQTRVERFEAQSWEALKDSPVYPLVMQYKDVFPDKVPEELPPDRGIRHEIDLVPGAKYCVTRQWPLPREQVDAIDAFFEGRRKSNHVRESKSPHCSPTFCVKKATGGWRIVHAFNKLNDATIPAQTPVPRKDMILDGMVGSTIFSAIDLMDGFYQIRMREDDIPLTAVSTPSGMLWEWLVMPQGLKNAPATFNRMVTNILRPLRSFAPSYFDDIFVHSKAENEMSDLEVHLEHLRRVFQIMRENKLYANLKKCTFCAPEIPVLGCFVGKYGVRIDPEKVKAIDGWPVPVNVKQLRQWLGLANYLHKYTRNYAAVVRPLTQLLRKDCEWIWTDENQQAFEQVKKSLREAPVLALPDFSKPFHVVCDASDYAIGCALMQHDADGAERVVSYQSRQLKPAEQNYPVHDKELLAMKYAMVKFRVYLLGEQRFAIYTDHASLRTATKSPHLSQRMARWLSFFSEYNFVVHYKPGKTNILADALSRRPDYDSKQPTITTSINCLTCATLVNSTVVNVQSSLNEQIINAYDTDDNCKKLVNYFDNPSEAAKNKLPPKLRASLHRYSLQGNLLYYAIDEQDASRVVVPNDSDLRHNILYEYHDSPTAGHLGREKTFLGVSRDYYWPHLYKWVRKYVRTCEICQRVKPSGAVQAPLRSLPVPGGLWSSVSMDFVFGLPPDNQGRTGILVFVDRLSKLLHLAPVAAEITAEETARLFVDLVFRLHGLPANFVSDRDPRFTSKFWRAIFKILGTRLSMSTAAHPETDGQTERSNRVVEDVLRSFATSFTHWSDFLALAEFSINNATHASTNHSPFYVNYGFHPRVPAQLQGCIPTLTGGETPASLESRRQPTRRSARVASRVNAVVTQTSDYNFDPLEPLANLTSRERRAIDDFISSRQAIVRFIRDAMAESQDRQKEQADRRGRSNISSFNEGERVLLSTANLPEHAVSQLGSRKLLPRFIGPFKVLKKLGDAYTLDIPSTMRLHPTFYVGRLKRYLQAESVDPTQASEDPPSREQPRALVPSGAHPQVTEHRQPSQPLAQAREAFSRARPLRQRQHHQLRRSDPGDAELHPFDASQSPSSRSSRREHEPSRLEESRTRTSTLEPRRYAHPSDSYTSQVHPQMHASTSSERRLPFRSPPPPLIDSYGNRRHIVEKILKHRDKRRSRRGQEQQPEREFLVRWLGYSPENDTWVRRSILEEDVPDVLREYETRQ